MEPCLAHPGSVDHIRCQGADTDLGLTRTVDGHPRRNAERSVGTPKVVGVEHVGDAIHLTTDDEVGDGLITFGQW